MMRFTSQLLGLPAHVKAKILCALRSRQTAIATCCALALLVSLFGIRTGFVAIAHAAASPQVAWASSMAAPTIPGDPQYQALNGSNFSCRIVLHPTVTGVMARLHLSNVFGNAPLTFGAVTVGSRASTGGVALATNPTPVTFSNTTSVTIPSGQEVFSDAISFPVTAKQDVAVSVYLPESNPSNTQHPQYLNDSYCTTLDGTAGDHTADQSGTSYVSAVSLEWVAALDVYPATLSGAIVALGDSITNGAGSDFDGNNRWEDVLYSRLAQANTHPPSVVNAGISGNILCSNNASWGPSGVDRLNHDALTQADIGYLILFEGTNDLAYGGETGDTVIACMQQVIRAAHTNGVKVIGATIIPRSFSGTQETSRQQVNAWVRTSQAFDGVIDFDAAVRDPNTPSNILGLYNSGDNVHPNVAGHAAMGNTISLSLFGSGSTYNSTVNDPALSYSGSGWGYFTSRAGLGAVDVGDDVHGTQTNGDCVSYPFTGTGVSYVTEFDASQGNVDVYLDNMNTKLTTVSTYTGGNRLAQQVPFNIDTLTNGSHTLKLCKASGQWMVIDAITYQSS